MDLASQRALLLPEIIGSILRQFDAPRSVALCARVNRRWFLEASPVLWQGSYTGALWKSPSFYELDRILKWSSDRLKYYLSHVRHLNLTIYDDEHDWRFSEIGPYFALNIVDEEEKSFLKSNKFECLQDISLWEACSPASITINLPRAAPYGRRTDDDVEQVLGPILIQGGLLGPKLRVLDLEKALLTNSICGSIKALCPDLQWLRGVPDKDCRGLVACLSSIRGLSLPSNLFPNLGFLLSNCPNLMYLELWSLFCNIGSTQLPHCFRNLTRLVIQGPLTGIVTLRKILAQTPMLHTLHVSGASSMFKGDQPFSCERLEYASFQCVHATTSATEREALDVISGFPRLKGLSMFVQEQRSFDPPTRGISSEAGASDNFATVLAQANPLLEELEWIYLPCHLSAIEFTTLTELKHLRALSLKAQVDLDLAGLSAIPATTVFPALECFEWEDPFYQFSCSPAGVHHKGYKPNINSIKLLWSRMPHLCLCNIGGQPVPETLQIWPSTTHEYRYWHQLHEERKPIADRIAAQSKQCVLQDVL